MADDASEGRDVLFPPLGCASSLPPPPTSPSSEANLKVSRTWGLSDEPSQVGNRNTTLADILRKDPPPPLVAAASVPLEVRTLLSDPRQQTTDQGAVTQTDVPGNADGHDGRGRGEDVSVRGPSGQAAIQSLADQKIPIKTLIVDTSAIVKGVRLERLGAESVVTIQEVLEEVRDREARRLITTLPFDLRCREPSDESLREVMRFARLTGDLHSLSAVDVKLVALAHTVEVETHGANHLNKKPPSLRIQSSRTRPPDPPGWGTNVPNLKDWEGVDTSSARGSDSKASRILPTKSLFAAEDGDFSERGKVASERGDEGHTGVAVSVKEISRVDGSVARVTGSTDGRSEQAVVEKLLVHDSGLSDARSVGEEGLTQDGESKRAAVGDLQKGSVQGVQGLVIVDDDGEWERAVGRSTRRKYVKRAAQIAEVNALEGGGPGAIAHSLEEAEDVWSRQDAGAKRGVASGEDGRLIVNEAQVLEERVPNDEKSGSAEAGKAEAGVDDADFTGQARMAHGNAEGDVDKLGEAADAAAGGDDDRESGEEDGDEEDDGEGSEGGDVAGGTESGLDVEFFWEGGDEIGALPGSECGGGEDVPSQPLVQSSVACMTLDYAMQNVILQMGLRLVTADGMRIKQVHRWALKCHACGLVTNEVTRLFCPKCGNGGTLNKVSVTLGPDGTTHVGVRRRFNLRGTKYSLPLPKGGREGASQNPILREDQLPERTRSRRTRNGIPDVFAPEYGPDTWFLGAQKQKNAHLKGVAVALSGRRNPNERRVSRKH